MKNSKVKLLLVDDETDILEIIKAIILSEYEIEILTATCGEKAIEILKSEDGGSISGIISDYNMQDGNGAVVYQYNLNNRKIPFCLLTGGFLEDYKDLSGYQINPQSGQFLITKPIEEEEVIRTIGMMLRNCTV